MRYRIEVIWYLPKDADNPAPRYLFEVDYTDDRSLPGIKAQWLAMFKRFYGIVIDTTTGAIEYEIGAVNRDWIQWLLTSYFETLEATV